MYDATAPLTGPIALVDVDDLAESDLEADLSERLALAGRVFLRPDGADAPADEDGRLVTGTGPRSDPADAVSLAVAIRRSGAAAVAVHELDPGAAVLAG